MLAVLLQAEKEAAAQLAATRGTAAQAQVTSALAQNEQLVQAVAEAKQQLDAADETIQQLTGRLAAQGEELAQQRAQVRPARLGRPTRHAVAGSAACWELRLCARDACCPVQTGH